MTPASKITVNLFIGVLFSLYRHMVKICSMSSCARGLNPGSTPSPQGINASSTGRASDKPCFHPQPYQIIITDQKVTAPDILCCPLCTGDLENAADKFHSSGSGWSLFSARSGFRTSCLCFKPDIKTQRTMYRANQPFNASHPWPGSPYNLLLLCT